MRVILDLNLKLVNLELQKVEHLSGSFLKLVLSVLLQIDGQILWCANFHVYLVFSIEDSSAVITVVQMLSATSNLIDHWDLFNAHLLQQVSWFREQLTNFLEFFPVDVHQLNLKTWAILYILSVVDRRKVLFFWWVVVNGVVLDLVRSAADGFVLNSKGVI